MLKQFPYSFILLLAFITSCKSKEPVAFDPFNYNPNAYEKVKLNYRVSGQGDTTLFFLHGWNLDISYWKDQEAAFSPKYKVVLMDMAGCGASGKDRVNWTVESFAKDVTSVITAEHLTNVILIGHSMSGDIALDAAFLSPREVIGIVGVDNFKDVGMTISAEDKKGIYPYIKNFMANYPTMAEGMAREYTVSKDSAVVHRIVNSYKSADPKIAVPALMNLYPKAAEEKTKLQQVPFTMKFIISTNTPYNEQALKRYCTKGMRIATIDSTGHFPMIERPARFNKVLADLLTRQ